MAGLSLPNRTSKASAHGSFCIHRVPRIFIFWSIGSCVKRERETWSEFPYRLYTSCTISHAALRLITPRTEAMQARIPAARAWPPRSRGPGTVSRHDGDPVQGPECTPPAWPGSMRPCLAQPIRYLSVTVPRPRRREASWVGFFWSTRDLCVRAYSSKERYGTLHGLRGGARRRSYVLYASRKSPYGSSPSERWLRSGLSSVCRVARVQIGRVYSRQPSASRGPILFCMEGILESHKRLRGGPFGLRGGGWETREAFSVSRAREARRTMGHDVLRRDMVCACRFLRRCLSGQVAVYVGKG